MSIPRWRARFLLALGGLGVALVAGEVALRVVASRRDLLLALASAPAPPPRGADFRLVDLLEPDPDPLVVYHLRAGLRGRFHGASLETNALGLRGPETTLAKPAGVRRILGLGDSVMFGWGVEPEQRFLDLAAGRLPRPGVSVEPLCLAAPGWNTVMEVAALASQGLRLDPDVVVLGFFANDLDLPNFLWGGGESPWSLRRSFLWTWITQLGARGGRRPAVLDAALRPVVAFVENPRDDSGAWRVAERFTPLVGWANAVAALDRLSELSRRGGFPVVVKAWTSHPEASDALLDRFLEVARARGFVTVDPRPALLEERRRGHLGPHALWLGEKDLHPNPRGHAVLARELARALAELLAPRGNPEEHGTGVPRGTSGEARGASRGG